MRNLSYPLDWDAIFQLCRFPAFFKPFAGGGWKHVYKMKTANNFIKHIIQTRQLVMMLQEEIGYGLLPLLLPRTKYVRVMRYDQQPYHMQYIRNAPPVETKLNAKSRMPYCAFAAAGCDFNTVELAIRDGEPYAHRFPATRTGRPTTIPSAKKISEWIGGNICQFRHRTGKST